MEMKSLKNHPKKWSRDERACPPKVPKNSFTIHMSLAGQIWTYKVCPNIWSTSDQTGGLKVF
jgi:hypothetical protein